MVRKRNLTPKRKTTNLTSLLIKKSERTHLATGALNWSKYLDLQKESSVSMERELREDSSVR